MAALSPWTFITVGIFVIGISLFNQFKMDNSIGFFQYIGYIFVLYGIIRLVWKIFTNPKSSRSKQKEQKENHHVNRNSHTYPHRYGQQQHNPYAQQQQQINQHVKHNPQAQQQQTQQGQQQPGNHQQSALFCRNCGKRISMQDNFCPHCGIRMR